MYWHFTIRKKSGTLEQIIFPKVLASYNFGDSSGADRILLGALTRKL
jgi:hypothetical protein